MPVLFLWPRRLDSASGKPSDVIFGNLLLAPPCLLAGYLELFPDYLRQENSDIALLLEVLYSVLDTRGLSRFLHVQVLIMYIF